MKKSMQDNTSIRTIQDVLRVSDLYKFLVEEMLSFMSNRLSPNIGWGEIMTYPWQYSSFLIEKVTFYTWSWLSWQIKIMVKWRFLPSLVN